MWTKSPAVEVGNTGCYTADADAVTYSVFALGNAGVSPLRQPGRRLILLSNFLLSPLKGSLKAIDLASNCNGWV